MEVGSTGRTAALLEIASRDLGKAQGTLELSNGQESGAGNDSGAIKFRTDFGVELEP